MSKRFKSMSAAVAYLAESNTEGFRVSLPTLREMVARGETVTLGALESACVTGVNGYAESMEASRFLGAVIVRG